MFEVKGEMLQNCYMFVQSLFFKNERKNISGFENAVYELSKECYNVLNCKTKPGGNNGNGYRQILSLNRYQDGIY
jgi:hypothetical protein